jgi:hypothetical protein
MLDLCEKLTEADDDDDDGHKVMTILQMTLWVRGAKKENS